MNDPHVECLYYTIKYDQDDYERAPPLVHEDREFIIHIKGGQAKVEMKVHSATQRDARSIVEPFLRVWELEDALKNSPGEFEFVYERAKIVDRASEPGVVEGSAHMSGSSEVSFRGGVSRSKYPAPPVGIAWAPHVELMFVSYRMYHIGRASIGVAAYFCLTALIGTSGNKGAFKGNRVAAAQKYAISRKVLETVGELSATKGGPEARKFMGAADSYTEAERRWLRRAMEMMILRAAEIAHDDGISRAQITMADLPDL